MPNVSKVKLNGTLYTLKDAEARRLINDEQTTVNELQEQFSQFTNGAVFGNKKIVFNNDGTVSWETVS